MKILYIMLFGACVMSWAGERRGVWIEPIVQVDYKEVYTLIDLADAHAMKRPFHIAELHKMFIPMLTPRTTRSYTDKEFQVLMQKRPNRVVNNFMVLMDADNNLCVLPRMSQELIYWCSSWEKKDQLWKMVYFYAGPGYD